jgi:hypothetical protein
LSRWRCLPVRYCLRWRRWDRFRSFNPEIMVVHVEENRHNRIEQRMLDWFEAQVVASIPYDKFSFHLIHRKSSKAH